MTAPDLADALRPIVAQLVEEALAARRVGPDAPDRLLSVEEASELLGIGRTACYELIARGKLRSVKVGRRRLVAASDLAAYIEATRAAR
jgi:excisionase family DNA binding protein